MAKDDDILDLDNLPEGQRANIGNAFDRFNSMLASLDRKITPDLSNMKFTSGEGISYNPNRGILKINGESVKFTLDKKMANLLNALFSEDPGRERSWDEVIEFWDEDIEDYKSMKQARQQIFDTGKNINKRVAADTANKNFLIVTDKKVRINPKYLGEG